MTFLGWSGWNDTEAVSDKTILYTSYTIPQGTVGNITVSANWKTTSKTGIPEMEKPVYNRFKVK